MTIKIFAAVCIMAYAGANNLLADFSYQQSSKITGGAVAAAMKMAAAFSSKAREPISSTVLLKGNRMAHINPDTAQIIDLDKETITTINYPKKNYSVMTFEQMKQMMQQMADKMGQQQQSSADLNFKASVKETGQAKTIGGLNTKEMILTMTMEGSDKKSGQQGAMNIVTDMWMAPEIPGYEQVRAFYKAMGAKIAWAPGQNFGAMMGRGEMSKGMADMAKEMAKMDGVPVLQVMTMTGSGDDMEKRTSPPPPSSDTSSQSSAAEALGRLGRLGGLGGFGRKKKDTNSSSNPPPPSSNTATDGAPGALMEMTTESSGFSSAPIAGSKFEVPAGFKEVEPDSMRRGKR